jgi:hypothetical protein
MLDTTQISREFVPLDDETFALTASGDAQPVLDFNKGFHLDGDGYTPSKDLKHVAKIPMIIVELWWNKHGIDVFNKAHADGVRKLLNDPEYGYLRTGGGQIGAAK